MKSAVLLTLTTFLLTLPVDSQTFERYKQSVETTLQSSFLGTAKNIRITLPLEFQENGDQRFPVIVVFDSQEIPNYDYTLRTIDYLTANEQMPSSVIVGIDSDEEVRYAETQFAASGPEGKAELTERFLLEEALPFVREQYHGSAFTTIIGHGRYAFFATYLLTRGHPEIHAVIAFNSFLEQKNVNLADSLTHGGQKLPVDHTLYFRHAHSGDQQENYVTLQALFGRMNNAKTHLDANGALFSDASDRATTGLYISQALYEIFSFWSVKQNAYFDPEVTQLPTAVSQLTSEIERHYGEKIALSLAALNGKGWSLYANGNFEAAIEAWQLLLTYYPDFSEAYLSIAYAQKDLRQPIDSTLRRFEENLHSSRFYSEREQVALMEEYELLLSIPETDDKN